MKMQNLSAKLGARLQKRTQRGFTLVEIAIVLLIIGLLLGGILRGQELITNAKVRTILDTKTAIRTAFYGFKERYNLTPGDMTGVQANALGVRGLASVAASQGDNIIDYADSTAFFNHLALKGFIDCVNCKNLNGVWTASTPNVTNSPLNPWGGVYWVATILEGAATANTAPMYMGAAAGGADTARNFLATGGLFPEIAMQLDAKTDDANPAVGSFRLAVSPLYGGTATNASCLTGINWSNETANGRSVQCQGGWFFD
jgi:prepilin-type N-terminal cleavage/methylation domain-containing protein